MNYITAFLKSMSLRERMHKVFIDGIWGHYVRDEQSAAAWSTDNSETRDEAPAGLSERVAFLQT